ncbi:MAG: c-type cytochrome biogenesis protein CcmI [Burkholderiales bacterium]
MTAFWTVLALLACLATASLVWPMLRAAPARPAADDDEARRLAVYRDRRREIEADRAAGRLTEAEAAQALDELASEADRQFAEPTAATASARVPVALVVGAALFVPLLAAVIYDRTGAPGAVAMDEHELRGEPSPARIAQAIPSLEARTRDKPDDAEAWAMLAEARRLQGDLPAAATAFAQANRLLKPPSARLLADHADVLVAISGGDFGPEPLALLERALATDPNDTKALAMMGAARYRAGRTADALALLTRLRDSLPPESSQVAAIAPVIERLQAELGQAPAAAPARPGASGANPAGAAPGPAAGGSGATQDAAAPVVAGRIEIGPALAARVPAGATLFISARAPDGPRMPLAARRLAAAGFPLAFELTEADAMGGTPRAWAAGPVVIEARISRSGQALRESGDLFGVSPPVKAGDRALLIRIDQVVP